MLTIAFDGNRRDVNLSRVAPGHLIAVQQQFTGQGTYDLLLTATIDGTQHAMSGAIAIGPAERGIARRVVEWCSLQLSEARQ